MLHTITTFLLPILVSLLALQRHRGAPQEISNVPRDLPADVKAPLEKIAGTEQQSETYGDRLNSYTSPKERKIRSPPANSDAAGVCDITSIRSELSALRSELKAKVPCVPASETWCPPSWSLFSNSCYLFISRSLNWLDAQKFMSHLVEIDSAEENDFVYNLIRMKGVTVALIGINDIAHDGNWVFTSGRPLSYTNWRQGEPNNYLGTMEDCGTIRLSGLWNDVPCNYTCSSVCERCKMAWNKF
ncbi:hypothetical protein C0Q70_20100 [Pomacea canaliculata]|uniref:C-type lectin domain-containing protein n=1 Tax=Pomacea canaliculata TaxID=400727 RepID=A0A2T7NEM1_POMCA|nr:hypothetical protein C0Q70_20100 [Pomacea canaliculata]